MMGRIETTYESVADRYPQVVEDVLVKLRKGKSKSRDAEPSQLEWAYTWGVRVDGMTGTQFIQSLKTGGPSRPPEFTTFEDYWEDLSPRITASLSGKVGRWHGQALVGDIPQEIKDFYRETWTKDQAEKARIAALSPEERNAEIQELLGQLQGPGFICVQVPVDKES